MWLSAYFAQNGSPKTGLSPTIDIYRISTNVKEISAVAMTEIGGGFYSYDFSTIVSIEDNYVYICDAITLVGVERYAIGEINVTDVDKINLAALSGAVSGGGTKLPLFKDQSGTTNRISLTVDRRGNRSEIILNTT